jgi:DNA polymerase (family 10)
MDRKTLDNLDYVIAGVHMNFKMDKSKMTRRLIKAMENPNVDIISHLTGRLLKKREEYPLDLEKIFDTAKKTGTILEINGQPRRLDLSDINIRRAKDYGIKMIINSDGHHTSHFGFVEYALAQARRGWATADDIINTRPWPQLKSFLKS